MQTSKIIIGELYAINTPNHGVVRFLVTAIKTETYRTAKKGSPTDTTNTIIGVIEEGDVPGEENQRTRQLAPEAILEHYTEYAELKARQEEEERIRTEKTNREKDLRERLIAKLYEITGIPVPPEDRTFGTHNHPFHTPYGSMVQVTGMDAIEKLLAALSK